MKIALFPGSFDPITKGHENLIHRAIPFFDKIVIGIGVNTAKKYLFPLEDRVDYIRQCFALNPKIEVCTYEKLTGEFCREIGAQFLIRGIRNAIDFQFEADIARANQELFGLETLFWVTDGAYAHVSSSLVRDLYLNHGNYQKYIPKNVMLR